MGEITKHQLQVKNNNLANSVLVLSEIIKELKQALEVCRELNSQKFGIIQEKDYTIMKLEQENKRLKRSIKNGS